ncbi:MAG: hypothetical protein EZS28_005638 [Streblomastix strix]|uniref:Tyr recombinase domain-containing protein n=1 Tax=Streblomastix strix TaxID=222440 RepID=A0A5J4WWH2_9EUKA|nr:MAG: hypothetical protein EZS28_005638 [Streblomastix strix]
MEVDFVNDGAGTDNLNRTHSKNTEHDDGHIEQDGDQRDYKLNADVLRKACMDLKIWPTINGFASRTNKQRRRYCSQLLDRNAVRQDCFNMNWSPDSGESGGDSECWRDDKEERVEITIRKSDSHQDDWHKAGEVLFREMLMKTGLTEQSEDIVIGAMNMETCWKRRLVIRFQKEYMDEKVMNLDEMKEIGPITMLIRMLTWKNDKDGTRCLADMQKIRTHVGVALGMFHNSNDVAKSSIVIAAVKDLEHAQRSQSKFSQTWDLDLLLSYMFREEWKQDKQTTSYNMALFVAFTAARMTELTRMKRKDLQIDEQKMIIQTKIIKGKKIREYSIELRRQGTPYCPVRALETWLYDGNALKKEGSAIWINIEKKK